MTHAFPSAVTASALCASVLLIVSLVTGCDDGNGPGTQRVHFSMSNYDGCIVTLANLDLAAADADIARNDDGSVACSISAELDAAGCEIAFTEPEGGGELSVEIGSCSILGIATLFSCDFRHVDMKKLEFEPSAGCDCWTDASSCYFNGICDLCASGDANRTGCENCDNNRDDDGDGELDCEDSDCRFAKSCGFGRTTVTCRSSSTTTTTSDTSDTSTTTTVGSSLHIEGPSILTAP
jgi:hypothetical protein